MDKYKKGIKASTFGNRDISKLLPQDREIEELVLGILMTDFMSYDNISDVLSPDSFYLESSRAIFEAIVDLRVKKKPTDILSVTNKLRFFGMLEEVGGPTKVTSLANSPLIEKYGSTNIKYYASVVLGKALQRQLIMMAEELGATSYDEDADPMIIIEDFKNRLAKLTDEIPKDNLRHIKDIHADYEEDTTDVRRGVKSPTIITSTYRDLNHKIVGLSGSDLVIIGARPSMGKTAMVLSMLRRQALGGIKPLIFSLEMSSRQLLERLLAMETGITPNQQKEIKALKDDQFKKLIEAKIPELDIYIDDTASITISQLKSVSRIAVKKFGVKVIYVDYIQLVKGSPQKSKMFNRSEEVGEVSRELKTLAKELDVPVIALAQLSREVESRKDKVPMLADLKQSGDIEQDADLVMFLLRREYYKMKNKDGSFMDEGQGVIIIAKNRNGSTGSFKVEFDKELMLFSDLDGDSYDSSNYSIESDKEEDFTEYDVDGADDLPF